MVQHWAALLKAVHCATTTCVLLMQVTRFGLFQMNVIMYMLATLLDVDGTNFCHAMLCIGAAIAGMRCLSVRHVRHVPKRVRYLQNFFTIGEPHSSSFSIPNGVAVFRREPPLTGASNARGYEKMTIFDQYLALSETVIVRWAHAARQFVSIEFSFHPYNI